MPSLRRNNNRSLADVKSSMRAIPSFNIVEDEEEEKQMSIGEIPQSLQGNLHEYIYFITLHRIEVKFSSIHEFLRSPTGLLGPESIIQRDTTTAGGTTQRELLSLGTSREPMNDYEHQRSFDPSIISNKSSSNLRTPELPFVRLNPKVPAQDQKTSFKAIITRQIPKTLTLKEAQSKISQLAKYAIHVSSLSVIITLLPFCIAAVMTQLTLNKAKVYSLQIVDEPICAETDPAGLFKDIQYIQGPALTALSMIALVVSIVNYALRLALEKLKGKYSSRWLWIFPLVACVLQMVAMLILFKGKSALTDLQEKLFKMESLNCIQDSNAGMDAYNEILSIFGQEMLFTVIGGLLSTYQAVLYLSNVFVIEFMQDLKMG